MAPQERANLSEQDRPLKGSMSLEIAEEPVFDFPFVSVRFNVAGNGTHLGRFTGTLAVKIDISREEEGIETSTGKIALTTASGDALSGSVTGSATAVGEDKDIVETVLITPGTGRFAAATGTFVIRRQSRNFENLPGSFEGTISY
jgi:hypothetical protein